MAESAERDLLNIVPVPSYYISPMWRHVKGLVNMALERYDTGYDENDVLRALLLKEMQLWVAGDYDAVVVTQILVTPQHKICNLFAVAGKEMNAWSEEMEEAITEWAVQMGCKYLTGSGRKGWQRYGEQRGWQNVGVMMGKEL